MILLIGDVINDVVVRPLRPVAEDSDTPADIRSCPGGSGANQAAWLGARARFAGRVGAADHDAHVLALRQAGVDVRLAVDEDVPTGSIVVLVRPDGRRDMYTDRGANLRLRATDLPDDLLDDVDLVHVSGYSLFHPDVRQAVEDLAGRARTRGIPLSVDPASAAFLRECGSDEFLRWSRDASLIFPNLDEGRLLTGLSTPDDIAAALAARFAVVALTLGPDGALVQIGDERVRRPAKPATVVDTTGAGDAFCAGFLRMWTDTGDPAAATESGLELAARAVQRLGARPV
jgi:sugar/nucleoside kinase (ribokinase family)